MNIEPKNVFKYFEELSNIPRESGNEKEVSNFLKKLCEEKGYEVTQDESLNIIAKVPATPGYEDRKRVILQGHMDMVCEKGKDSDHDFLTDPIELIVDGDKLHANDTTLGADDGIGVAMSLALAEEEHGPMTIVVTVSEETDMHGAKNLEPKHLEGDYLINIDSEEEGILTVSSAGGKQFSGEFKAEMEDYSGEILNIHLHGLLGGHSGMEIANNKGNMIKIIFDLMGEVHGAKIVDVNCGTKQNAIPREGYVSIAGDEEELKVAIEKMLKKYESIDGNLEIEYDKDEFSGKVITEEATQKLVELIDELPTGPNTFLNEEEKVLESSSNLAIVRKNDDKVEILVSLRYASSKLSEEFGNVYANIAKKYGVEFEFTNPYPEWEYKKDSEFREIVKKLFIQLEGKEMTEEFTHGGLECGVFFEKNNNLDIVSIGPDITGAHTQKETLDIKSTERVYEHLKEVLKNI
ncbi:beta-Ala-His dipeptidase [Peptoniphilus sp.]|jgi:dipeptidase D|uniref:beta-Ala-His dipeptidase n=1 Tax=Peptoniphilus sp. TaxID=1971214 RepID=UPI003D948ABD